MNTIRSLLQEYEAVRSAALLDAERRRQEAYALSPRLKEIMSQCMRLRFEMGAMRISAEGSNATAADMQHTLDALCRERDDLLASLGLDENAFAPRYRCSLCGDTGYCGDPVREMCICLRQRVLQLKCSDAGLASGASFEAFDLSLFPEEPQDGESVSQREQMSRAKAICLKYAQDFPKNEKSNLLLRGATGLGKTYLLDCIARRVIERGYLVLKQTAYAFVNQTLASIRERQPGAIEQYILPDLLILDDLGSEPVIENITIESLFSVLNERMVRGKHTVTASNLKLSQIKAVYGERVLTRLSDQTNTAILQLQGKDIRFTSRS